MTLEFVCDKLSENMAFNEQVQSMVQKGLLKPINPNRELSKGGEFRSLEIYEGSQIDNFRRIFALVEDVQGNKAVIFCHQDNFKTTRKDEESSSKVFGHRSILSGIEVLKEPDGEDLFDRAIDISFASALRTKTGLEMVGLKDDRNIQLSGGSIVIVPDPDNPDSINQLSLQKAIGKLFSKKGPFNEMILLPISNQEGLADNLRQGGTVFLFSEEDFQTVNKVLTSILDVNKSKLAECFSENFDHITKALMAKAALLIHLFRVDAENKLGTGLESHLKIRLILELEKLIKEYSVVPT